MDTYSGRATCEATANIAVVKYWGKRDEHLVLPTNSSVSFTMDEQLKTRTTVMFSPSFKRDEFWLNGRKVDLQDSEFAQRVVQIDLVRKRARIASKAKVVSLNCFPTAAGFASSAAGFAALACASAAAAGLRLSAQDLSILARRGSGSACRSVLGGCVEWVRGERADGSDSVARQVAPHTHWPQLRNVIAVVDAGKKKVSSRAGMRQTVETSRLFEARSSGMSDLVHEMKSAVLAKDFEAFAELTMRESSNMHAVMLDTWPPITYLNDHSRDIMYAIGELNEGELKAAYTFDAGPNAHVYTLEKNVDAVKRALENVPGVHKIMVCKVGGGPTYLERESEHFVDERGKVKEHSFVEGKGIVVK